MPGTWLLMFGPPFTAGGPPRTVRVDGQRLVFSSPPAAAAAASPFPAPAPAVPAAAVPAAGGG
eukprot:5011075-Alexandrium_andersonii.AAC.1